MDMEYYRLICLRIRTGAIEVLNKLFKIMADTTGASVIQIRVCLHLIDIWMKYSVHKACNIKKQPFMITENNNKLLNPDIANPDAWIQILEDPIRVLSHFRLRFTYESK